MREPAVKICTVTPRFRMASINAWRALLSGRKYGVVMRMLSRALLINA